MSDIEDSSEKSKFTKTATEAWQFARIIENILESSNRKKCCIVLGLVVGGLLRDDDELYIEDDQYLEEILQVIKVVAKIDIEARKKIQ